MAIEKPTASKSVDPKVVEILDRLDLKTQDSSTFTISGAWRYRQPNMSLSIEHAAGGIARTACQARLLWRDGIALLSSSFSYAGSACTLLLVSNEGDLMSIRGAIEACRHVQGNYHELKIKFTHSIEPQMFIENNSKGENGNGVSHLDPSHLRANIVHLDDSEADARLLTHHLRDSGITLRSCRTPADALAALKDIEMADIFLCDLNLGNGKDSIPVIRDARSGGFTGPIVLLTAEHQPGKLESAKQAGVDVVLAKPFTREALMNVIVRLHHQVGAIAGDTLYSTMSEHPDVADLVGSYVTEMKGMAKLIGTAIAANDLDGVRDLCLRVKGTAGSYGFAPLSSAAEEAIRALDATMGIDEAKPKLRSLSLMTNELAVRAKPDDAAKRKT